jgi:tRNA 2-(methylsulfanyl)-N6-isopentenyladenosine37 hydroxylase
MLRLASVTPPAWTDAALGGVSELLLDHAHCELKAASTALGLAFRCASIPGLPEPLSRLAREELEHFELVLAALRERGIAFGRAAATPYAARLHGAIRGAEPSRLVDTLLCCALIEARSCERMQLLATRLPDPSLRDLYEGLLASEARHHATYVDLALEVAPRTEVLRRLDELAAHEASVLADSPRGPRLHE